MPKSAHAKKIMAGMKRKYGKKAGERVFYATARKQGRSERTYHKKH